MLVERNLGKFRILTKFGKISKIWSRGIVALQTVLTRQWSGGLKRRYIAIMKFSFWIHKKVFITVIWIESWVDLLALILQLYLIECLNLCPKYSYMKTFPVSSYTCYILITPRFHSIGWYSCARVYFNNIYLIFKVFIFVADSLEWIWKKAGVGIVPVTIRSCICLLC